MEYKVKRLTGVETAWVNTEPLCVCNFPWDNNGYKPEAAAGRFYSSDRFHVFFETYGEHIRAVNAEPNSYVCQDSCVEFFVNPCPELSQKYVNIEINPIGTKHIGIGVERRRRTLIGGREYEMIKVKPYIDSPNWGVVYTIPFEFFYNLYGPINFSAGRKMKANFYKCGDLTRDPHWACWNEIKSNEPNFHLPEFFGDLILE
jgi:hypothetical protein